MQNLIIIFLITVAACCYGENPCAAGWRVGQEWQVEVVLPYQTKSLPRHVVEPKPSGNYAVQFTLKVERLTEIDGEICFQLRSDAGRIPGMPAEEHKYYRLYMRTNSLTLKRVERVTMPSQNIGMLRDFPAGAVCATERAGILPLEFPDFSVQENKSKVMAGRSGPGGVIYLEHDHGIQQSRSVVREKNGKKLQGISAQLEKLGGYDDKLMNWKSKLTWICGMPWWSEIHVTRGNRFWCSGRLLSVDGKDVTLDPVEEK